MFYVSPYFICIFFMFVRALVFGYGVMKDGFTRNSIVLVAKNVCFKTESNAVIYCSL